MKSGTREWSRATAIRVRSTVPEIPRATGNGCSPGCRAQPSPLMWQLSRAYKAQPHAGADYNSEWMWRVDLHHHRQVYETCAPLFVLRHRRTMAPREVLAPSSLPLQGSACAVSAIEARLVRLAGIEPARLKHGVLSPRVSAYSTTGVWCGSSDLHREATGFKPVRSAHSLQIREWCQAPDSHREAVRFELTRYANSHQLGGTRGQTRTDIIGDLEGRRRSHRPGYWRPELDSNQHRPLRRPSTGPSAGADWSGRRESNPIATSLATMSRTMRDRMLVAAAGFAPATSDLSGRCSSA